MKPTRLTRLLLATVALSGCTRVGAQAQGVASATGRLGPFAQLDSVYLGMTAAALSVTRPTVRSEGDASYVETIGEYRLVYQFDFSYLPTKRVDPEGKLQRVMAVRTLPSDSAAITHRRSLFLELRERIGNPLGCYTSQGLETQIREVVWRVGTDDVVLSIVPAYVVRSPSGAQARSASVGLRIAKSNEPSDSAIAARRLKGPCP